MGSEAAASSELPVVSPPGIAARVVAGISVLARFLIQAFLWGDKTGKDVKDTAASAVADGLEHPDVLRLAHLQDDHAHGELLQVLQPSPYSKALTEVEMPFKKEDQTGMDNYQQTMFLPHLMFAEMYEHQPNAFVERFCGGSFDHVQDFWDSQKGNPQLEENDDLKAREDYRTRCLPFSFHGDGVSVVGVKKSWQQSCDVFSGCGVLGKGPQPSRGKGFHGAGGLFCVVCVGVCFSLTCY